jgi:phospho-N-acetylmuramoyl-pentapeptide-transferase
VIALLLSAGAAFLVAVVGTPFLIRVLKARGIGQQIRDDGPFAHPHMAKAGTPTMGGIALVGATVVGYLVAHLRTSQIKFARAGMTMIVLILALAVVGFVDDYLGVRKGRNLGLRKRGKMGGQLLVGSGFALLALYYVDTSTHLAFTRQLDLDLGTFVWFIWALLIVTGTSNAVNITDGMDGLAAGASTLVFAAFVIITFWQFRHPGVYGYIDPHQVGPPGYAANALDLSVVAAALMGACAGFLWWNAAPARVFMGDTGSLALGGAMGGLALLSSTDLLLPILGGLFVLETTSVIAQIVAFRGFHRRVLRMAPIHHHFEVGGWPEFTVIVRFWLLAGLFVALGLGLFYADFIRIPGVID